MSATRPLPVDDMTTARAVRRAEAVADRWARLAYVRGLLIPHLDAANDDVDDAEAHVIDAVDELHAARARRDRIAEMLTENLIETERLAPVAMLGALEAMND